MPARLVRAAEEDRYELVVSERLLRETGDVLTRPKFRRWFPEEAVPPYLARLTAAGIIYEEGEIRRASPDPKDDYLVALALASDADPLVSKDPHLLNMGYVSPFMVIIPRQFLDEVER